MARMLCGTCSQTPPPGLGHRGLDLSEAERGGDLPADPQPQKPKVHSCDSAHHLEPAIAGDVTISMPSPHSLSGKALRSRLRIGWLPPAFAFTLRTHTRRPCAGLRTVANSAGGFLRLEYRIHNGHDLPHRSVDVHREACQVHVRERRIVFNQCCPRAIPGKVHAHGFVVSVS
jgi:hypothetical protein